MNMTKDEIISRLKAIEADVGALMRDLIELPVDAEPAASAVLPMTVSDGGRVVLKATPITIEELRATLTRLSSEKGAGTTKSLLAEYGAKKLSEVPAEKYFSLLADAKAWADE